MTNTQTFQHGGTIIKKDDTADGDTLEEEMLTGALCQALILKKQVSPDRFSIPGIECESIQCPSDCHLCCKVEVTLDLTAAESLMIYLLNKDVVDLIEEYTRLHEDSGYCTFMIMDKCIINAYKPSACQMYMPFSYKGKPMCLYLNEGKQLEQDDNAPQNHMNSSSYDIHGFMVMIQGDIDKYIAPSFFKNILQGTLWWKDNYHYLPENTRICLESILDEDSIGLQLMDDFKFEEALLAGHKTYIDLVANHPGLH